MLLRYISVFLLALMACCFAVASAAGAEVKAYRVLFIGDSITSHGPKASLKWTLNCGMAASAPDRDYVHLVLSGLAKAIPGRAIEHEIAARLKPGNKGSVAGSLDLMDRYAAFAPDFVVVQLGEHEHPDKGIEELENTYRSLLQGLLNLPSHPLVVATGRWSPTEGGPYGGWIEQTDSTMARVAAELKVPFASVQDMARDKSYRGFGEHSGVQWHPNDKAMAGYAQRILAHWETSQARRDKSADARGSAAGLTLAAVSATAATRSSRPQPLRGFTVDRLTLDTLQKAANTWKANSVRFMMRPNYRARSIYRSDVQSAWKRMVDELPAQLDQAKALNLAVVLCLFDVPNPRSAEYPKGKERLTAFWSDETNLQYLIECWTQVAKICKDRDQEIWFEILNEPLDWKDFPSSPKAWPRWAQATIDAIRAIDRRHPVVIEAGPGGLCWAFKDFTPLRGEPIIYATHNYQPHEYTHQGIKEISATDLKQTYLETNRGWPGTYSDTGGGLWDKPRLVKELQPLIDFQKRHGVRVYISEFGVVKWAPDAAAYLRDSLEVYESLGWDWSLHALDENPMWSPEYGDAFEEPGKSKPATTSTARAAVIREFMGKGQ